MSWAPITPFTNGQADIVDELNQFRDNLNSLRSGNGQLVKLYLAADQSIASGTKTVVDWDLVAESQVGSIWSIGNPSRLYNNSGYDALFTFVYNVEWLTSTTGERSIGITRNGDTRDFSLPSNGANQGGGNQSGMLEISVDDGDFCEAFVRHTNGSTISVHGGSSDRTSIYISMAGVF